MRIDFKFRHFPASDELTTYVHERIDRLERFEMKPLHVEFTFSSEKETKCVAIHVRGQDIEMHATSDGPDYFTAIDLALEKMARQLSRKKARVQGHQKNHRPKAPKVS